MNFRCNELRDFNSGGSTMGTAGLDIRRLISTLKRHRIKCELIEGDALIDHCVLLLSSESSPKCIVLLEYENKGFEPRVATLTSCVSGSLDAEEQFTPRDKRVIQLRGSRGGDVAQLVSWLLDLRVPLIN
jgi:hypothetical protein